MTENEKALVNFELSIKKRDKLDEAWKALGYRSRSHALEEKIDELINKWEKQQREARKD